MERILSPQLHLSPSPKHPKTKLSKTPSNSTSFTITPTQNNSGLLFHEKILFIENTLNLNSSTILSQNPSLRSAPLSSIHNVLSFLQNNFQIYPKDSTRIFQMYPHLITCDPVITLLPVYNFLLQVVKLRSKDIRKAILRCPRLLVCNVEDQLRPAYYFLRRLGLNLDCDNTVLLVSSVEQTLLPKFDYIMSLGFTYNEARKLCLRSPGLLTFSVENNFKPKVEYLEKEMKRDVKKEVKEFPQYFSCSLEGKIRPRWMMLVENGVQEKMALKDMLKASEGEFRVRLLDMKLKNAALD